MSTIQLEFVWSPGTGYLIEYLIAIAKRTMKASIPVRVFAVGCMSVVTMAALPSYGLAVEPVQEFLKGLRERRYFDLANHYLEQMKTNPLVPPEARQAILYEQGVNLVATVP